MCENYGCSINENTKTFEVIIYSISEEKGANYLLDIEIWNSKTNNVEKLTLKVKKSLIKNDDFVSSNFPSAFDLEIVGENIMIPIPFFSHHTNKLLLIKQLVNSVNFISVEDWYLGEDDKFNLGELSSQIKESLEIVDDLPVSKNTPNAIFVFQDTISIGRLGQDRYSQISLSDIIGAAQNSSAEQLKDNCKILKKYYPNQLCNYYSKGLRTLIIKDILAYDIPHYNIEKILESSIVGDAEYVEKIRSDQNSWAEYYDSKNILFEREISLYSNSFLEYLYYSDISCSDSKYKEICDEIFSLYEYSKFLTTLSEGNLCSNISYLPLLVSVSDDQGLKEELEYILDNYPFESECMTYAGSQGFCSIDLDERFSCIELLYNSLKYYKNDNVVQDLLQKIVEDTLRGYLDDNKGRVGLWGKEDINLLISGNSGTDLYPIKYYDLEGNYLLYNILREYISESD